MARRATTPDDLPADDLPADELDDDELDDDATGAPVDDPGDTTTGVADQWARYRRPDGSVYLVCVADLSGATDDERAGYTTAPESPDHVRLDASNTP